MDIKELIAIQKEFDSQHGWLLKSEDANELLLLIRKDLIGLFGEVGEFANIIKKISLEVDLNQNSPKTKSIFEKHQRDLELEIVDSLIYIIRLATHLNMDIEKDYLNKLEFNRNKYRPYEINPSDTP
jgi:NTP pyrophosphatase (non-canonical NTP hydrolase)